MSLPKAVMSISIHYELYLQIRKHCDDNKLSMSKFVSELAKKELNV